VGGFTAGGGLSKSPGRLEGYTLGTYITQDARAAIDHVCQSHNAKGVHWVGHSMGGILGLALITEPGICERLRSVVTLASALTYQDSAWRLASPLTPLVEAMRVVDLGTPTALYANFPLWTDFVSHPGDRYYISY
jgi:pimeloyl-ACP methyl ester carboxylesterase